jgi:hypothetical protein
MLQNLRLEIVIVTPTRVAEEEMRAACVQDVRGLGDGRFEVAYSTLGETVPPYGSVVYTTGPQGPASSTVIALSVG